MYLILIFITRVGS